MRNPTRRQIERQIDLCYECIDMGVSKYHGMSYEEGVRDAIDWLQGNRAEPPMEDDDEEDGG